MLSRWKPLPTLVSAVCSMAIFFMVCLGAGVVDHGSKMYQNVRCFSRANSENLTRVDLFGKFHQVIFQGRLPPEPSSNVRGVLHLLLNPLGKYGKITGTAGPQPWDGGIMGHGPGPVTLSFALWDNNNNQYMVWEGMVMTSPIKGLQYILGSTNASKMQMSCATWVLKTEYPSSEWFETQEW